MDDDIREETRVVMRPRRPPRPKSEMFLEQNPVCRRTKRFSAFGVSIQANILIFNEAFELITKYNNLHNIEKIKLRGDGSGVSVLASESSQSRCLGFDSRRYLEFFL